MIDANRRKSPDYIETCVFCQIASEADDLDSLEKGLSSRVLLSNSKAVAFKDRSPQGVEHYLIIPRVHVRNITWLKSTKEDIDLLESMISLGKQTIEEQRNKGNEREATNEVNTPLLTFHIPPFTSVNHLHLHVLGIL